MGSSGIAPLILKLGTIRSEFSVMLRPPYHLTNSVVSNRKLVATHRLSGVGGEVFLGYIAPNIVTILTDLSLPHNTDLQNTPPPQGVLL